MQQIIKGKINYSTHTISNKSFYKLLKYTNRIGVAGAGGVIFDLGGNIIYSYNSGLGKKWIIKQNGLSLGTLGSSSIECVTFRKREILILGESKKESYPLYQSWNW